jgi:hypothetical protein
MAHNNIDLGHHVIRHIPWNRLMKDEQGQIVGCFPQAFYARDGETYLSVNWLEYFSGGKRAQLKGVLQHLAAVREIKLKQGLGICTVVGVHQAYAALSKKGRVIHTPNAKQDSYSRITKVLVTDRNLSDRIHALSCIEVVPISSL